MSPNIITVVAGIIIALLGGGGLVAILKVRPEAAQISVSAAQGAVIVQTGVIEALREENRRLAERLTELERTSASLAHLQIENVQLRARVSQLERELAVLKNGNGK